MALAHPVVEAVQVVFLGHQHAGLMAHRAQAHLVDLADISILLQHLGTEGDDVVDIGGRIGERFASRQTSSQLRYQMASRSR